MLKSAVSCTRSLLPIFLGLLLLMTIHGHTFAAPSHTSLTSPGPAAALAERQAPRLPQCLRGRCGGRGNGGRRNGGQDDPDEKASDDGPPESHSMPIIYTSDEEPQYPPPHVDPKKRKVEASNDKKCPDNRKCANECCDPGYDCTVMVGRLYRPKFHTCCLPNQYADIHGQCCLAVNSQNVCIA